MKKKLLSLALALVMCLGLTVPAFAAEEQKITVNGEEYERVLQAIMSEEEDKPVTLKLESDIQVTATVVLGSSDYDGLFNGETMTVASHDVTIDLNGHALTAEKDFPIFEVQKDYKLTVVDTSAEKTGTLVGETAVSVADGGEYVPLTSDAETPAEGETPAETPAEGETPAETPAAASKFTDVAPTSPFAAAIDWAVAENITLGTTETTFGPSDPCSIRHILTFIWRANGKPYEEDIEGANDLEKAVKWAQETELIAEDLDVSATCTRGMAVRFLWLNAMQPVPEKEINFTDVEKDSYFESAIAWAVEAGVTNGTSDTTFSPEAGCTRGQIVTFLYRADQAAASAEAAE